MVEAVGGRRVFVLHHLLEHLTQHSDAHGPPVFIWRWRTVKSFPPAVFMRPPPGMTCQVRHAQRPPNVRVTKHVDAIAPGSGFARHPIQSREKPPLLHRIARLVRRFELAAVQHHRMKGGPPIGGPPVTTAEQQIGYPASASTALRPGAALRDFVGHQFARPISAASAGTVMVRTTNVSINRPAPMMKPICSIVETLPNIRPNIEAAKMMPAEVITPPVECRAQMSAERMPLRDSSRMRVINNRL